MTTYLLQFVVCVRRIDARSIPVVLDVKIFTCGIACLLGSARGTFPLKDGGSRVLKPTAVGMDAEA